MSSWMKEILEMLVSIIVSIATSLLILKMLGLI